MLSALGGCASYSRLASYGNHLADANVYVDGKAYSIWVHPTDDDLLVQRGFAGAMGQSFVEGMTFGGVAPMAPKPVWRRAAELLTKPLGCAVTDVYSIDNRTSWEAPYSCPPGVDLRAKVDQQRVALRAGRPIQP